MIYNYCNSSPFHIDKAAAIKIQLDLKILSYVDADYRPTSWLAYLMTSKPAGKEALVTMLPRLNTDNVVLTQCKQVRRAAKDTARAGQPKIDAILPPPAPREVIMYHKIAKAPNLDPCAHLKRKLDAYATQISFLQELGQHEEVLKYKRLQLAASTSMCDELAKLDDVALVNTQSSTVIDLLNSSTSSAYSCSNTHDEDDVDSV